MKLLKISLWVIIAVLSGYSDVRSAPKCSDLPSVDKLDKQFCPKDGKVNGHTIVILDLTSRLEQAQIDYVDAMVFSERFFKSYDPFTKFSYVLIDGRKPQSQIPKFLKCRPKTGINTKDSCEHPTWGESRIYVNKKWKVFIKESEKISQEIFEESQESDNSLIYETIASIFKIPKFDFDANYPKRKLIIVSDMMQHSKRISFYNFCRDQNSKKPNKCPRLDQLLTTNSSTKEYIERTSPTNSKNVDIQIIFLNNRYETSKTLGPSLISLWTEYFERAGFKTPKVEYQLDID